MPYSNLAEQREYQRLWMRARRASFFDGKACHCGSTDRLELDHVDPSKKVSHRIWSWCAEKRAVEIAKCQVLCAKHHAEKTVAPYLERRVCGTLAAYKHGCRCELCRRASAAARQEYRTRTGKR